MIETGRQKRAHWAACFAALFLFACRKPASGEAAEKLVPTTAGKPSQMGAPTVASSDGDWVRLSPASFRMGSVLGEPCRDEDEAPVEATLSRGFEISRLEVNQGEFERALGYNPSFRQECSTCPVDSVSRSEAALYCNSLSDAAALPACYTCSGEERDVRCVPSVGVGDCSGYRLPTEAEWEYAARAGSRSATPEGNVLSCMARDEEADRYAWYKANSGGESHPGGTLNPNHWGLYDLQGNVYEWTSDWYSATLPGGVDPVGPRSGALGVLRGGSWYHNAHHARLAKRLALPAHRRTSYTGFRCVRSLTNRN